MTLDELIAKLLEAKEHGIQGKRKVLLVDNYSGYGHCINDVVYDDKNVTIGFD